MNKDGFRIPNMSRRAIPSPGNAQIQLNLTVWLQRHQ
jgi:hypothetical protein